MKCVILCGGSGTRLWPVSTKSSPKQFTKLINGKSLFQLTIERNLALTESFIIVSNLVQFELAKEQTSMFKNCSFEFILEPLAKNTAAAIGFAALIAQDENILVVPSDHLIKKQNTYIEKVQFALSLSNENQLVTFGIQPTHPETGYGYIQYKNNDVLSFKEKPSLGLATQYVKSNQYLWNSGMFCFKANKYLESLKEHASDIYNNLKKTFESSKVDGNVTYLDPQTMSKIKSESIDYAVMEKEKSIKVVPADIDWYDLGSFDSLLDHIETDQNTIRHESSNNFVFNLTTDQICLFNVDDLIIIKNDKNLLIGKKGSSQNVKKIVEALKEQKKL